jgi:hypothetical protein
METQTAGTDQELIELQKRQNGDGPWTENDRKRLLELLELQNAKTKTSVQKPPDLIKALHRQGLAGGPVVEVTKDEKQVIMEESRRNIEKQADKLR